MISAKRARYIRQVSKEAFKNMNVEERAYGEGKEIRCLNPKAKCHVSGKRLFLKKCIKVQCSMTTPISGWIVSYYFVPEQLTLWYLKK